MTNDQLDQLLNRSAEFLESVCKHIEQLAPFPDDRPYTAFQAGLLSVEHASGSLVLISSGLVAPGITLMRTQFEALVRGIWLLHAASDNWITKLSQPLTAEAVSSGRANEGPMLGDMLKELERDPKAPQGIVAQLCEYRDVTWKALNSYSHAGLHPLSRTETGYPAPLIYNCVRNSNAIVALTAQLLSLLTGDDGAMGPVRRIHEEFRDCLPIVSGS